MPPITPNEYSLYERTVPYHVASWLYDMFFTGNGETYFLENVLTQDMTILRQPITTSDGRVYPYMPEHGMRTVTILFLWDVRRFLICIKEDFICRTFMFPPPDKYDVNHMRHALRHIHSISLQSIRFQPFYKKIFYPEYRGNAHIYDYDRTIPFPISQLSTLPSRHQKKDDMIMTAFIAVMVVLFLFGLWKMSGKKALVRKRTVVPVIKQQTPAPLHHPPTKKNNDTLRSRGGGKKKPTLPPPVIASQSIDAQLRAIYPVSPKNDHQKDLARISKHLTTRLKDVRHEILQYLRKQPTENLKNIIQIVNGVVALDATNPFTSKGKLFTHITGAFEPGTFDMMEKIIRFVYPSYSRISDVNAFDRFVRDVIKTRNIKDAGQLQRALRYDVLGKLSMLFLQQDNQPTPVQRQGASSSLATGAYGPYGAHRGSVAPVGSTGASARKRSSLHFPQSSLAHAQTDMMVGGGQALPQTQGPVQSPRSYIRCATLNIENPVFTMGSVAQKGKNISQYRHRFRQNDVVAFQEFPTDVSECDILVRTIFDDSRTFQYILQMDTIGSGVYAKMNRLLIAYNTERFSLLSMEPIVYTPASGSGPRLQQSVRVPKTHDFQLLNASLDIPPDPAIGCQSNAMGVALMEKDTHTLWLFINVHLGTQKTREGLVQVQTMIQHFMSFFNERFLGKPVHIVILGDFNVVVSALKKSWDSVFRRHDNVTIQLGTQVVTGPRPPPSQQQYRDVMDTRKSAPSLTRKVKNIDGIVLFEGVSLHNVTTTQDPMFVSTKTSDHPIKQYVISARTPSQTKKK